MNVKKLTEAFYIENSHLVELLDKHAATSDDGKTRGYGIALVTTMALRFGIPFRSHISHNHCFKTSQQKGLDFSKAVLLLEDRFISPDPFKIPNDQFVLVREKAAFIEKQFNKYVKRYVDAANADKQTFLGREYKYSTLQNYHAHLGVAAIARST